MKPETRTFSIAAELRAKADFALEGYAASFNVLSGDLGGFRERIAPGAFTRTLDQGCDVKCLVNHNPSLILGRVKNGSLKLSQDFRGLRFVCKLDPKNAAHQDVYALVQRGDLDECSFAFHLPDGGDVWDEGNADGKRFQRRTLKDVDLHDVAIVTTPAYAADGATSVQARAAGQMTPDEVRAARIAAVFASFAKEDEERRRRCDQIGLEIAADQAKG
jgi:uncharacterized protein